MHLARKPDARNVRPAGLIHRLAYGTRSGTPPVRRILLSVSNQRRADWVLGGSDTSNGPVQREDNNLHAGGPKVNPEKGSHGASFGFGFGVLSLEFYRSSTRKGGC